MQTIRLLVHLQWILWCLPQEQPDRLCAITLAECEHLIALLLNRTGNKGYALAWREPLPRKTPLSCTFNLMLHLERSFNHEELFLFKEGRFFLPNQPPGAHESVLSVGQEKVIHLGLSQCLWQGWCWEVWGSAALAGTLSVPSHEPELGKACPIPWSLPAEATSSYVRHGDTWNLSQNSSPDFC